MFMSFITRLFGLKVVLDAILNRGLEELQKGFWSEAWGHFTLAKGSNDAFTRFLALYCILLMLQFFKIFRAQPRLMMVDRTISTAFNDTLHFMIVFIPVFGAFVISVWCMLGSKLYQFRTFLSATQTCFNALMGDFEWQLLSEGENEPGFKDSMHYFFISLWFISFMITCQLILLNMLVAIVLDALKKNSLEIFG